VSAEGEAGRGGDSLRWCLKPTVISLPGGSVM
jgi:hypothetical protein